MSHSKSSITSLTIVNLRICTNLSPVFCRRTYKAIQKGSELLVYYGDAYARELNIDVRALRKAPAAAPPKASSSG